MYGFYTPAALRRRARRLLEALESQWPSVLWPRPADVAQLVEHFTRKQAAERAASPRQSTPGPLEQDPAPAPPGPAAPHGDPRDATRIRHLYADADAGSGDGIIYPRRWLDFSEEERAALWSAVHDVLAADRLAGEPDDANLVALEQELKLSLDEPLARAEREMLTDDRGSE